MAARARQSATGRTVGAFLEMIIRVKNLRLRTVIGINDWERKDIQDVVINLEIEYDGTKAADSDRIEDGVNYRAITKRVIREVEESEFHLLDALANRILRVVMEEKNVHRATVEVDKPQALRFADSVSVSCSAEREP